MPQRSQSLCPFSCDLLFPGTLLTRKVTLHPPMRKTVGVNSVRGHNNTAAIAAAMAEGHLTSPKDGRSASLDHS